MRPDFAFDIPQLLHQLLVNLQTACRINDDDIISMRLRIIDRRFGNGNGISPRLHCEDRQLELLANHLQLLDGSRAINIAGYKQRMFALLFKGKTKLSGRCCLTGALQTDHHNDRRRIRAHIDTALRASHEVRELFINNLDNDLGWSQCFQNILPDRAFFDRLNELFDYFEIDVGLKKGHPHFAHGIIDIVLRQLAMTAQFLKRLLQAVG